MRLLFEVLILLITFWVISRIIRLLLRKVPSDIQISQESRRELKRFKRQYILIFIGVFSLGTLLFRFFLILTLRWFLRDQDAVVLIPDDVSLLMPSFLMAFVVSVRVSRWLNVKWSGSEVAFFLKEYSQDVKGYDSIKIDTAFSWLLILFSLPLVYAQFHTYLKCDGEYLLVGHTIEGEKKYELSELIEIEELPDGHLNMIFEGSTEVSTLGYQGDLTDFANLIRR